MRLIARSLDAQRWTLALALIGSFGYSAAVLILPVITQQVIDTVIVPRRPAGLPAYGVVLAAVGLTRAGGGALRKYQATRLGAGTSTVLRRWLFAHVQQLSFSFHDRMGSGQLMARASSDATMVESAINGLPFMIQTAVVGIGSAAILFWVQPLLAAAVVATVFGLGGVAVMLSDGLRRRSREIQERVGSLTEFVEQMVNGIHVIKGHGIERNQEARGYRLVDLLWVAGGDLVRTRAVFIAAVTAIPTTALMVSLGLGGWLALQGQLSPGKFLAFVQYMGALVGLIPVVVQALGVWPQALASATRIDEVLRSRPEISSPAAPRRPALEGALAFEGVTFGYVAGAPVIRDLTLDVPPGTTLALVGPSGSGKSTIAKLVPRFYEPWQGNVLLDGIPVSELDLHELRRRVCMVFDDTTTFSRTVRANIALGRPGAALAEVEEAARLAQAAEFIERLPHGYDTELGEQGLNLSGGQRQRLALARAILQQPRVLILDDATSALDPSTQIAVVEALRTVLAGRTVLVIAHRPETVALAASIAVVDRGRVVALGPRTAMEQDPAYRAALALDARGRAG